MKVLLALVLALEAAVAFPSIRSADDLIEERSRKTAQRGCRTSKRCNAKIAVSNREAGIPSTPGPLQRASAARTNCGAQGACTVFDEKEQFVSVSGRHRYLDPTPEQIRGPCPGLNAAANHDYLPRSGVPTILETITGLGKSMGMSIDLAGFLAAYAVALDGDVVSLAWSIGGPPQTILPGILGPARGISYSHNKYEGDSSIGRCDAAINGGDAHSLSIQRFRYAFEAGMDNNRYTLDKFSREFAKNTIRSIRTNPLYFAPLFSTTLVSPAAYNFVINFMSNHTNSEKSGYLDGKDFKTWFGVSGKYPNFKWLKGKERIPENWYRRPSNNQYTAASVFLDLLPEFAAYPSAFRFGGNSDGVDTYTGIDINDFSGGAFNAANLLEGDNLACFLYQNLQQGLPDILKGRDSPNAALRVVTGAMDRAFGAFTCRQAGKIDPAAYNRYPGNTFNPSSPEDNVLNC